MLRNRKRFYYSNVDNKAERDVFKIHWTQEAIKVKKSVLTMKFDSIGRGRRKERKE